MSSRATGMILLAALAASVPGCSKKDVQDAVLKPAPAADAGAATPEELAELYQATHRQQDVQRYRERVDVHLVTLRDWVPLADKIREELAVLFDFELEQARFEKLPPNTPPEDTLVWYLRRTNDGGQSFSCSTIGLPAVGKLVLTGRWPGGQRLELDAGLAVVKVPTAAEDRYFVDRNVAILHGPVSLLAKARAACDDGSDHFRGMPLGIDHRSALMLAGTREEGRYTKSWAEAVGELDDLGRRQAQGESTAPVERAAWHGAPDVEQLVELYTAAHRAKDPRPLRERIEWNFCTLPAWAALPRKHQEAISLLFGLSLAEVRVRRLPADAKWILYLGPRGARFMKLLQLGAGDGAVGKLLLTVCDRADNRIEIDPGLVVVYQRMDFGEERFFLLLEERVTRFAVAKLKGEAAPEYRALPLGIDPDAASRLLTRPAHGLFGPTLVQKSWEEANRDIDAYEQRMPR